MSDIIDADNYAPKSDKLYGNSEGKLKTYHVAFNIVLPGMTKPTPFSLTEKAHNQLEAHANADAKWLVAATQYDLKITEVK